jgi:hypothetical protein
MILLEPVFVNLRGSAHHLGWVHIEKRNYLIAFHFNSAGIGVVNAASRTMARMLGNNKVAFESARSQFWIVDANVSLIL